MITNSGFESIREKIADKLLLVGLIVSIPAGIVSGIRIFTMGVKVLFVVDVLIALILFLVYITRSKTQYRKRIAFLLGYVFLMGVISLNTWGLFGFGLFIMFFSIIITTALFGFRSGLLLIGISMLVLISLTLCVYFDFIHYSSDFNQLSYSTFQWFSRSVFFVTFASMALVTLGMVHENFEKINKELAIGEERFRTALSSVNEVVWELDFVNKKTFVSEKFSEILHFAPDEMAVDFQGWLSLIHPVDAEYVNGEIQAHISGKLPIINIEYRIKDKKGGWHWILTKGKLVEIDSGGKPARVVGTHTDIGPRKEMERILLESEQRFRMLFMNANDAILLLRNDVIIDCNLHALDFFSNSKDNIVGHKLTEYFYFDNSFNGESLEMFYNQLNSVLEGKTHKFEQEFKNSLGEVLDAIMSISLILENDERLFQIMLHDITERRKFEQAKLVAVVETEERERLKLAGDLHDDVGPLLSSLNMYLSLLNRKQTESKSEIIESMQGILKDTIASVREISSNLSPHMLFKYGIVAALNSIIDQSKNMVNINFTNDIGERRLSDVTEIMTYRIVKELLNNTLKYACARNVYIDLTLRDSYLSLSYEDDGVGFDFESKIANKETGIGLVNIQERLKTLKATYEFNSKIGHGFKFIMKVRN